MAHMATRIPGLNKRPIAFAHRGARAAAPDNTLESFALAVELGATGLETDAWITADGVVVLDHDGTVGSVLRKRSIRDVVHADLPSHIPTLLQFYETVGADHDVSIDVKDDAAFEGIVAAAREVGAIERLWLCHPDLDTLVAWRHDVADVRLVNSTRLDRLPVGPERRAAELAGNRIDAVNFHRTDWTGGLTTLFHRFEVLAFGWDAQHERHIAELVDAGIDGLYSDHVDRMIAVLAQFDW